MNSIQQIQITNDQKKKLQIISQYIEKKLENNNKHYLKESRYQNFMVDGTNTNKRLHSNQMKYSQYAECKTNVNDSNRVTGFNKQSSSNE